MPKAFKVTHGKGFQMTFKSGYTLSVQWGAGNYCDHYGEDRPRHIECGKTGSDTAEIAVVFDGGLVDVDTLQKSDSNQVRGYCTLEEVCEMIARIAAIQTAPGL